MDSALYTTCGFKTAKLNAKSIWDQKPLGELVAYTAAQASSLKTSIEDLDFFLW